ncbi:MAG TPA: DNA repair protein RecN [Thermopetrobacter sp.]|nr:DNA repair protein RecN [Thermopetrobacter sp.]
MLTSLFIRDIVLIERLELPFAPGLSVLSGETGAGKSILLDALGLALGARGDAGLVRSGADQGVVTARFEVAADHAALKRLAEAGIEAEDGALILRRVQKADGATRAFINDQPVAVSLLREVGARLVEIHGQHEARTLIEARHHRELLDAFGGLEARAATVARRWREWREARKALEEARAQAAEAERERDFLQHAVAELEELAPQAGEEERLAERRAVMMHAEQFADALNAMRATLQADGSMAGRLNAALKKLERRREAAGGLLDAVCEAFDRVLVELAEAEQALDDAQGRLTFDAAQLEEVEERLFALRGLARKHRVTPDDLPALLDDMRGKLALLGEGAARIGQLEEAAAAAERAYLEAARALSAARREAAERLAERVMAELPALKLGGAAFRVDVTSDEARAGPEGIDNVAFLAATNPGSPPAALARVASGGELSRFMLALKVVLAATASAPVLVFDEIDTGVGGAVAAAVGERLARLAAGGLQVLAVTHLPQVAAGADHHFVIGKRSAGGVTRTEVRQLTSAEQRREEIARMLSAHEVTDEARAAAARLLGA